MKAAVNTRYGPPEVVQIAEVAAPSPGDGELLIKVCATTVNRTDCHYRSGRPLFMRALASGLTRPKATLLGNEFAGQVVAAGRGAPRSKICPANSFPLAWLVWVGAKKR